MKNFTLALTFVLSVLFISSANAGYYLNEETGVWENKVHSQTVKTDGFSNSCTIEIGSAKGFLTKVIKIANDTLWDYQVYGKTANNAELESEWKNGVSLVKNVQNCAKQYLKTDLDLTTKAQFGMSLEDLTYDLKKASGLRAQVTSI